MFDFTNPQNIGKEYKGFILLSIDDIPDYKTQGVYLRHKNTGLEVYHMLKNDKENLFAFGFRTLAKDSKGAAHIMEHSVLCGSEKYPLKEPFSTLASTSLNTFINAFTYPDKTVYPGASLVRSDYFTMMDVYADAVFFPKLEYSTFIQEAHRLEMDENENLSIQGVVYNEMKGNYSAFKPNAYNKIINDMFPNSYPAFDSGGDPLEIPNLTYQEFLDYHQKFYNPDNCILFLYGDIPTVDQINYLAENFMGRIEKKYNCTKPISNYDSKLPLIKDEIKELQKLEKVQKSQTFYEIAPENGATGNFVCMNWYSGINDMEKYFLSEVISGNDSSPFDIQLKKANLGDEISIGNFGQYKEEFFTAGIFGVKKGDEEKVFSEIKKAIKKIYKKGFSQKQINAAVMGIDLNLREENRYMGPYSVQIMEKVLKGWQRGDACSSQLTPITAFEKVKENIKADKEYTKKIFKKYFMDPEVEVRFVVEPSPEFLAKRKQKEDQLLKKLSQNVNKQKLRSDLDILHHAQQKIETPEETKCIPSTKLSSLDEKIEIAETKLSFIPGYDGSQVPLFVNKEDTHGIFYLDVLFPFDNLDSKYFKYLPLLNYVSTNLGWGNKKWDKCTQEAACITGDNIWGNTFYGRVNKAPECQAFAEEYKEYNFCDRQWMALGCKALTSKAEETLNLFAKMIPTMSFKDKKHFKELVTDYKAEKVSRIEQSALEYSIKRASALVNENCALIEILWGITQLETAKNFTEKSLKDDLQTLRYIYYECLKSGGIVHITADEDSLKTIMPLLQNFAINSKITKLLPGKKHSLEELKQHIYKCDAIETEQPQLLKVDTQSGYSSIVFPSAKYCTKEAAAEIIFNTWVSNHTLWDKIRTTGGAYGSRVYTDSYENKSVFWSYRDPTPEKSIQVFFESLEELSKTELSLEDVEKTIVSCYGEATVPVTPKDRAHNSFDGMLYANSSSLKLLRLKLLLSVKQEDVTAASKRLYEYIKNSNYKVIFCDKNKEICGRNVEIPL